MSVDRKAFKSAVWKYGWHQKKLVLNYCSMFNGNNRYHLLTSVHGIMESQQTQAGVHGPSYIRYSEMYTLAAAKRKE